MILTAISCGLAVGAVVGLLGAVFHFGRIADEQQARLDAQERIVGDLLVAMLTAEQALRLLDDGRHRLAMATLEEAVNELFASARVHVPKAAPWPGPPARKGGGYQPAPAEPGEILAPPADFRSAVET